MMGGLFGSSSRRKSSFETLPRGDERGDQSKDARSAPLIGRRRGDVIEPPPSLTVGLESRFPPLRPFSGIPTPREKPTTRVRSRQCSIQ